MVRAVVVEFKSSVLRDPYRWRWVFRYLWAKRSLAIEFESGNEHGEFLTEGTGPRTEMQLRELFEVANKLHDRETAEPLKKKWPEVRPCPLDHGSDKTGRAPGQANELAELEDRAAIAMKLAAVNVRATSFVSHDSETVVLEGFLCSVRSGFPSARVL